MYRIHAGSPRASPYDAAMLLQAYDLDYNHKNRSAGSVKILSQIHFIRQ